MKAKKLNPDLRASTDAAVAAWRAARDATTTARDTFRAVRAARGPVDALRRHTSELAVLRAEDEERTAQAAAVALVDAVEVASGDELARARDARVLHDDLAALLSEENRIRDQFVEAQGRTADRLRAAATAQLALTTRRQEAGLPTPEAIALPAPSFAGHRDLSTGSMVEALAARLADGPPAPKSNAEKIRRLEREENEVRAALELERLEREQAAADRAAYREEEARETARRQRRAEADRVALEAEAKKRRAEIERLAAAHRAREASEVSS